MLEVLQKFHQLDKMMDIYGRLILISIILNVMAWYFGLVYLKVKPTGPVRFTTTDVNGHETSSSGTETVEIKHYQECGFCWWYYF